MEEADDAVAEGIHRDLGADEFPTGVGAAEDCRPSAGVGELGSGGFHELLGGAVGDGEVAREQAGLGVEFYAVNDAGKIGVEAVVDGFEFGEGAEGLVVHGDAAAALVEKRGEGSEVAAGDGGFVGGLEGAELLVAGVFGGRGGLGGGGGEAEEGGG